jgi:hypothetical protein
MQNYAVSIQPTHIYVTTTQPKQNERGGLLLAQRRPSVAHGSSLV